MSTNLALLLTPIFSRYDVLESGIVSLYLKKAMNEVWGNANNYVLNLFLDTPWMLYQSFGLYNPSRTIIDPADTKTGLGPQQVILIIAYTAVVVNHMYNAKVVVVNGNGPVVNTGYASLATLSTAMGKKLIYWKDDARRLWGFNDNPLMIGTMPSVSDHLMDPAGFPNRLNLFDKKQPFNCGAMVLPTLLQEAINTPNDGTNVKLSPVIENLRDFGGILNTAFGPGNPDGILWSTIMVNPLASYKKLKSLFKQYGQKYLSPKDNTYIQGVLSGAPSVPPVSRHMPTFENGAFANMARSQGYIDPRINGPLPIGQNVMEALRNITI